MLTITFEIDTFGTMYKLDKYNLFDFTYQIGGFSFAVICIFQFATGYLIETSFKIHSVATAFVILQGLVTLPFTNFTSEVIGNADI